MEAIALVMAVQESSGLHLNASLFATTPHISE